MSMHVFSLAVRAAGHGHGSALQRVGGAAEGAESDFRQLFRQLFPHMWSVHRAAHREPTIRNLDGGRGLTPGNGPTPQQARHVATLPRSHVHIAGAVYVYATFASPKSPAAGPCRCSTRRTCGPARTPQICSHAWRTCMRAARASRTRCCACLRWRWRHRRTSLWTRRTPTTATFRFRSPAHHRLLTTFNPSAVAAKATCIASHCAHSTQEGLKLPG